MILRLIAYLVVHLCLSLMCINKRIQEDNGSVKICLLMIQSFLALRQWFPQTKRSKHMFSMFCLARLSTKKNYTFSHKNP